MADIIAAGDLNNVDMKKYPLRPLVPGEKVKNKDGSVSTELKRTVKMPSGEWAVFPSLWKNTKTGEIVNFSELSDDTLAAGIPIYEQQTKKKFPRFKTFKEARQFEETRPRGVAHGPLAAGEK